MMRVAMRNSTSVNPLSLFDVPPLAPLRRSDHCRMIVLRSARRYCWARMFVTRTVTTRVSSVGPAATTHRNVMPGTGVSLWLATLASRLPPTEMRRGRKVQLHQLVHLGLGEPHRTGGFTSTLLRLQGDRQQSGDRHHADRQDKGADQDLDELNPPSRVARRRVGPRSPRDSGEQDTPTGRNRDRSVLCAIAHHNRYRCRDRHPRAWRGPTC